MLKMHRVLFLMTLLLFSALGREQSTVLKGPNAVPSESMASFRAVGHTPEWSLVFVSKKELHFFTGAADDRTRFDLIERYSDQSGSEYKWRSNHNVLFLRIEKRSCLDRTTKERYDKVVYLNFDGKELRGCGKGLSR